MTFLLVWGLKFLTVKVPAVHNTTHTWYIHTTYSTRELPKPIQVQHLHKSLIHR